MEKQDTDLDTDADVDTDTCTLLGHMWHTLFMGRPCGIGQRSQSEIQETIYERINDGCYRSYSNHLKC